MTDDELSFRLETYLAHHDFGDDGSHDISHLRRVRRLAHQIADHEGQGDRLALTAAAYLHDIVNLPKDHPQRADASQMSAKAAASILKDIGLDESRIILARGAIVSHSYSAGFRPETVEARILQDADRIEALGAIGIARLFYIAGKMGSQLFDPDEPIAQERALNDKKFALDHFFVKLFKLPDLMQTVGGKTIASQRVSYMQSYIDQFLAEI